MASWRDVVLQTQQLDIERKRSSPAVQNFGALVRTAMQLGMQRKEEARTEAAGARNVARTALYQRRPEMAAQALGIELPEKEAMVQPGMGELELNKVVYDEYGNPTYTYAKPTDKEPSWGQEQKIEALKTGLRMGRVVIGKEFGEPAMYPSGKGESMSMEQALRAIQDAGLSPELFANELRLYDVIEARTIRVGKQVRVMQKLSDGRVVWADTKKPVE